MNMSTRLMKVCRRHILGSNSLAAVLEPYIPFIPKRWNGTLILAEAQNLSDKSSSYLMWLKAASPKTRMQRLGRNGSVGVGPWDNGSLKLAVESALQLHAVECAISNGTPWSLVSANGNNQNPSKELIDRSVVFWTEMLPVLRPAHIITVGSKAREIVSAALKGSQLKPKRTMWVLPSPRLLSPLAKMVHEADLLQRFPEVEQVIGRHPEWIQGSNRKNKILFACLAVSETAGRAV
jgi:hypothetical protein